MSTRFPDVNSKQIVKVVEKLGFRFARQSGTSHAIYFRELMEGEPQFRHTVRNR